MSRAAVLYYFLLRLIISLVFSFFSPFVSCTYEDTKREIFNTAASKSIQTMNDSLSAKLERNKIRMREHPFNIESGEIFYIRHKKINGIYYPQDEMILSFEQFGKVQLAEIKSSKYDFVADKKIQEYWRYFKVDSFYYEINGPKKSARRSKTNRMRFDLAGDTSWSALKRTNWVDKFDGKEAVRYIDAEGGKDFFSIWNGVVLYFEGKISYQDWKIIAKKIKTSCKIPAKKFEIPKDYRQIGFY